MTTWQRVFASRSAIHNEVEIGRQIIMCERVNAKALAKGMRAPPLEAKRRALAGLAAANRRDLNGLAQRTAADADARIRARLAATAVRAPTGVSPHLASLIFSRPLGGVYRNTGSVGIARESTLNRAVNPNSPGYGPYWRAQEYGTGQPAPGQAVPTQVGRTIVGFFYGPGGRGAGSRPQSQYAGGGGPHSVFISGSQRRGTRGGAGGKGTIQHDIKARHFIRDGADAALVAWAAEMRRLDRQAASRLARAGGPRGLRGGRAVRRRR